MILRLTDSVLWFLALIQEPGVDSGMMSALPGESLLQHTQTAMKLLVETFIEGADMICKELG